jgi:Flp pilus assembly protein TadG
MGSRLRLLISRGSGLFAPSDRRNKCDGQSLTETLLLMPLFLLFVFGLLQVCQLGIAILMVNYAASSIARKAASENNFAPPANVSSIMSNYQQKSSGLMVAGMQPLITGGLLGCVESSPPTANLFVAVRTKISAWPFFAQTVDKALRSPGAPAALSCSGNNTVDFSNESGAYYFYVTGQAKVRLNYAL